MTNEKAEEIVRDIRAVCERHGVALVPVEPMAGRYGRIEIVPVTDMPPEDAEQVTNLVTCERFRLGERTVEIVHTHGIGVRP